MIPLINTNRQGSFNHGFLGFDYMAMATPKVITLYALVRTGGLSYFKTLSPFFTLGRPLRPG